MKCPLCSCVSFYLKDPDDEYETYEFELKGEDVVFDAEAADSDPAAVKSDTEVFCEKCTWHDKFQELKNG